MPIQFKSKLSSQVANDTFLDKTIDDLKKGKLSLYKVNVSETDFIDDLQVMVNAINGDLGRDGEVDPLSNTYSSEEIIANGDNRKVAIGKLDAQVDDNLDTIDSHAIILIDHETRISDNETNIATNTTDITTINDSLGQPNGIATLAGDGKVPATQLPSYVDDVEEYADLASFPATGETGKIYVAIDTGKTYRWSGTIYVEISASDVNSVNSKTGIVVLDKTDIGLTNVTDDAQLKRAAGDLNTFTEKATPVIDDIVIIEDSEDSFNKKKVKLANMLGGGGGSGINHITNPDFDSNIDGWIGDTNIVLSQETIAPLRGEGSLKIDKSAIDASTQVFYTDFSVPLADLASIQTISYDYDFSDANYNDGDLKLQIIQDPLGTPVSISLDGDELEGGKSTNYLRFQTDHTIQDYRLQFIWEATTTDAVSLLIDNVVVAPQVIQQGAIVTNWKPYTPITQGFGSISNNTLEYRRVGGNEEIRGGFDIGVRTAVEAQVSLPNSSVVESLSALTEGCGSFSFDVQSSSDDNVVLCTNNDGFINFGSQLDSVYESLSPRLGTQLPAGRISITASIPIKGFSSQANMSSDFGGRSISLTANNNSGEIVIANSSDITFSSTIKDSTASWNGTQYSVKETSDYDIDISLRMTVSNQSQLSMYIDGVKAPAATSIPATASFVSTLSLVGYPLNRGDVVSFRVNSSRTLQPDQDLHRISIAKRSNPQTQLESETVAARYTSDSGQVIGAAVTTLVYEDLKSSTHGIYNNSTGVGTITESGFYSFHASYLSPTVGLSSTQFQRITININSTPESVGLRRGNGATTSRQLQTSIDSIGLNVGDTFSVSGTGSISGAMAANAEYNHFSFHKVK